MSRPARRCTECESTTADANGALLQPESMNNSAHGAAHPAIPEDHPSMTGIHQNGVKKSASNASMA